MLSKEQMIEAIYEKIADKNLSFGCKIYFEDIVPHNRIITFNEGNKRFGLDGLIPRIVMDYEINPRRSKIIGHPVMIGDVLDYNDKNHKEYTEDYLLEDQDDIRLGYYEYRDNIIYINRFWKNKRKPIEEQSDDCIIYVYNLIK